MRALCLVLQHFQDPLKGLHEIVQTHHASVVFYINHNDGTNDPASDVEVGKQAVDVCSYTFWL